jgi:hypothetical protein
MAKFERDDEISVLQDLVQHPGWQILCEVTRKQWTGEPFVAQMIKATGGRAEEGGVVPEDVATERVTTLLTCRKTALDLLTLPERRLTALKKQREAAEADPNKQPERRA